MDNFDNNAVGAERSEHSRRVERVRQTVKGGTRMITLASGKGGVGKSSFAVNLAVALSQLGSRVLVVDADFGLANIDVMLGAQTKFNIAHFLRGEKKLDDIVHIGYDGVRFISGGSGVAELLKIDNMQLVKLMNGLNGLDMAVDFILCDAGAGVYDSLLKMVDASSETIIVTTPEPTAMLNSYALIKRITNHDREHPLSVVMNQAENLAEADRVYSGFSDMLHKNLGRDVECYGRIVTDKGVSRSIKRQTPVMISAPKSSYARDIRTIARKMLNLPPQQEYANIFARLIGEMKGE